MRNIKSPKAKKYLFDLAMFTGVMILVPGVFNLGLEKKVAAVIAGLMFVVSSGLALFRQYRDLRTHDRWMYYVVGQFFVLFALPIFIARVWNWDIPFEQISFLGIPGPMYHQISTFSFIVMWFATTIALGLEAYKIRKGI